MKTSTLMLKMLVFSGLLLTIACLPVSLLNSSASPTESPAFSSTDRYVQGTQTEVRSTDPDFLQSSSTSLPDNVFQETPTSETSVPLLSPISTQETSSFTAKPFACTDDLCVYNGTFFLKKPIQPPGNDTIDVTYRFGSTQSGKRDPHHGVEFLNAFGTPVVAAGDGKVVVAGTDVNPTSQHGVWPITFYGPYSNFYGNLVVIEHAVPAELAQSLPDLVGPIYTLYGHLSEIAVQVGEEVKQGQPIGKVGQAGIATGAHLHFEVRVNENSYKASRNPELWIEPHADITGITMGAIAGSFLNSYAVSLEMPSVVLQHLPQGADAPSDFEVTVATYQEKGLVGQLPFLESFSVGSLPAGLYRVAFPMGGLRRELVQVYPGQLTVVTFRPK